MSNYKWSQELEDNVVADWTNGLSASQIGAKYGLSRNSVIGKIYRLNLPPRAKDLKVRSVVVTAKRRRDRSKEIERYRLKRQLAREQRERDKQLVAATVPFNDKLDAENPGVGILDLGFRSCRSVLRYSPGGLPLYCGEATQEGHSFCPRHSAIYYNYEARKDIKPFRLSR